jgi:hypothetical protein
MTNNNKRRVTVFIDPDLLKQSKAEAIIKEISLSELIEKSLINFLPKETIIKIKKTEV